MAGDDSLLPNKLLPLALSLLPSSTLSPTSTSSANEVESSTTSPSLNNPIEALALLIHSIQTSVGFRLIEPKPVSDSNQLPLNWSNNSSPKFKYKHEQSSLDFIITIVELGGRALIAAVAVEDNKSVSFDLLLLDYFSPSAFPFSIPPPSFTDNYNSFSKVFSSEHRIKDLITLYRLNILQPLIPGLRKEGYTELDSTASTTTSGSGSGLASTPNNPNAGPSRGYYPDTGGPLGPYGGGVGGGGYGIPVPRLPNLPNQGGGGVGRIPNLGSIGSRDLDPLGGGIPGFPGMRPGGIGDGGGMFMGPDHPLFRERFGPDNGMGGMGGGGDGRRWGGDGWLPQGAVPPGARFDPIGPSNGPPQPGGVGIGGFGGGRGIGGFNGQGQGGRGGGGGGGGGRGGFGGGGFGGSNSTIGGDPDWDELPPPGDSNPNNDYDAMFG